MPIFEIFNFSWPQGHKLLSLKAPNYFLSVYGKNFAREFIAWEKISRGREFFAGAFFARKIFAWKNLHQKNSSFEKFIA
jgi:hypothetical protein